MCYHHSHHRFTLECKVKLNPHCACRRSYFHIFSEARKSFSDKAIRAEGMFWTSLRFSFLLFKGAGQIDKENRLST